MTTVVIKTKVIFLNVELDVPNAICRKKAEQTVNIYFYLIVNILF